MPDILNNDAYTEKSNQECFEIDLTENVQPYANKNSNILSNIRWILLFN